ncbi:unnamed protein product [Peniophora sp. CBMAI 1063]|nr:unnamed protein product [Peniophora sp. CBMAI 1063]
MERPPHTTGNHHHDSAPQRIAIASSLSIRQSSALLSLPTEIKCEILSIFDPEALFCADLVCQDLHQLLASPCIWCNVISGLLGKSYSELPFSRSEARSVMKTITLYRRKCDLCEQDGKLFFYGNRWLCSEHRDSETTMPGEATRERIRIIMGRRRKTRIRSIYPQKVRDDFHSLVQRVLPVFKGKPYQKRRYISQIRLFWEEVNATVNELKEGSEPGIDNEVDLHAACTMRGCKDQEAHARLEDIYKRFEMEGKRMVESAALLRVLRDLTKVEQVARKQRQIAGKEARRRSFQQRLEDLGYSTTDVEATLVSYMAHSSKSGPLTEIEFHYCLPGLQQRLDDRKRKRMDAYLPVRIDIAVNALLGHYATNNPDSPTALERIQKFLKSTPYTAWCPLIANLIDRDSFDTPEDRQLLCDDISLLLHGEPHVGQCILDGVVTLGVQKGELFLSLGDRPPMYPCPLGQPPVHFLPQTHPLPGSVIPHALAQWGGGTMGFGLVGF